MFDRQGIPDYLISAHNLQHCDVEYLNELSGLEIAQTVSVLIGFSFITQSPDGKTFGLHRLVQFATKTWLDCESTYGNSSTTDASILESAYPAWVGDDHMTCAEIEPHANALSLTCKDTFDLSPQEADLLRRRADYSLYVLYRPSTAAGMNGNAMVWRKHVLGTTHNATIYAVGLQCFLMNVLHEYSVTVTLGGKLLESYSCSSSSEDGDTRESISNVALSGVLEPLAQAHRELGQLDEALRVLERAAHKLDSTPKLQLLRASVLDDMGRHGEARKLRAEVRDFLRDLVSSRKQTLGPYHVETLDANMELGTVYQKLDDFLGAKAMFIEVSEALTHCRDPDERRRIDALESLVEAHMHLNELVQAEGLLIEVLAWKRRTLGSQSLSTMTVIGGLAILYFDKHDLVRAKPLLTELWQMKESPEQEKYDMKVNAKVNALGYLVRIQREGGEQFVADSLWDEVLNDLIGSSGSLAETLLYFSGLRAMNMKKQGRVREAHDIWSRILPLSTKAVSLKHEFRATVLEGLALCKEDMEELCVAESLWDQALDIRIKSLGPLDEKTLGSMDSRAFNLIRQGRHDEACKSWSEILTLATDVLGTEHELKKDVQDSLDAYGKGSDQGPDEDSEEGSDEDWLTKSDEGTVGDAAQSSHDEDHIQHTRKKRRICLDGKDDPPSLLSS